MYKTGNVSVDISWSIGLYETATTQQSVKICSHSDQKIYALELIYDQVYNVEAGQDEEQLQDRIVYRYNMEQDIHISG